MEKKNKSYTPFSFSSLPEGAAGTEAALTFEPPRNGIPSINLDPPAAAGVVDLEGGADVLAPAVVEPAGVAETSGVAVAVAVGVAIPVVVVVVP
jgi:hypothetical protein